MTHPDTSGMLRFVTDELQNAEDAGDRGPFLLELVLMLYFLTYFFQCGSLDTSFPAGMGLMA